MHRLSNFVIPSAESGAHLASGPVSVSPQSSVLDEPLSPKGKTERLTPEPLDQRGPGDLEPEGKDQETDSELSGQQPEMSQVPLQTDVIK